MRRPMKPAVLILSLLLGVVHIAVAAPLPAELVRLKVTVATNGGEDVETISRQLGYRSQRVAQLA